MRRTEKRIRSRARTHVRTHRCFPARIDEGSNRRSQLATRVDRCETGSDGLTFANKFANLFRRSTTFRRENCSRMRVPYRNLLEGSD